MKKMDNNLIVKIDYSSTLHVPGITNDITLFDYCWCTQRDNDGDLVYDPECQECGGTGIEITDNGKAIIALIEIAKEN